MLFFQVFYFSLDKLLVVLNLQSMESSMHLELMSTLQLEFSKVNRSNVGSHSGRESLSEIPTWGLLRWGQWWKSWQKSTGGMHTILSRRTAITSATTPAFGSPGVQSPVGSIVLLESVRDCNSFLSFFFLGCWFFFFFYLHSFIYQMESILLLFLYLQQGK